MSAGHREVIIILGKTGFGKSTWLQTYVQHLPKLFPFDPFAAIQAEYLDADTIIQRHEAGYFKNTSSFRCGTHKLADMELLGAVAFLTTNCTFVVEECGVAFYKGERIPDWLSEIIFLGRHHNVSLILTAQRAASIPIELRSQASRFISFRQTEKRDLEWTRDYLGDHYEQLSTLDILECLDADRNGVTRYRINPPGSAKA